ncbi:nuclear transport factor 2 family protein [Streptomyces sp. SM10]|uniref:nuclear transport factor 2 family protein n=1 Tax=Streptomyces sp. SM10 TaxID=565556 RepID=UPI000CD4A811|nr:nuclear transport factor 2 family protein [Streptomyces sp. SM10]
MPHTGTAPLGSAQPDIARLHGEISHFYARQMQALDEGRTDDWAQTFTEDGAFLLHGGRDRADGCAALAASSAKARAALAEQGVTHRHWLGMLTVEPRPDGTVAARCYALVIATETGGSPAVHRSTVCQDLLVSDGDAWLVKHRQVTRDDLV